ncbi:MAG: FAD-dependent oxidoreductase [Desulfomonilaceae bacterium]|nr:FAD-dependent oxidoreductase [Desulfomonilaceae bacterium]
MSTRPNANAYGRQAFPNIFQEGYLGKFKTTNRCKYAACSVSNYNTWNGFVTERELYRDEVIAQTGAAILTNQGAYPDASGEGRIYPKQLAIYDDRFIPGMKEIVDVWRKTAPPSTVLLAQILHGGRYGGYALDYCWQPSDVPQKIAHFGKPPREMTKDDIAKCVEDHANAAKRFIAAGFDGVEVTAFTGYILANFNSKFTNRRTDEYGGSIENRGRFMVELLQALRKAIGDHLIVGVRLNSTEQLPGGNTDEECIEFMKMAQDVGVDYVSNVIAWHESDNGALGRHLAPDHWMNLLEPIRKKVDKVALCFGPQLRDPFIAEKALSAGLIDYWELCRPFLADPDLLNKTARNDAEAIKPCIGDLMCISKFMQAQPYLCTCNPMLGHEQDQEYVPAPVVIKKRVMVVGGGPGGIEAALQAHKRGHEVAIFEKGDRLGGQLLSAGRDMYGGYNYLNLLDWYEEQIRRQGIDVYLEAEATPRLVRKFEPDAVILATGSTIEEPNIPGIDNGNVVRAFDVLQEKVEVVGSHVAIIGGGKVGCPIAFKLTAAGKDVTIIEKNRQITFDVPASFKWRYTLWSRERDNMHWYTEAVPLEINEEGVRILKVDGEETTIKADTVVLAYRRSVQGLIDYLDMNVDEVIVVGDAVKPRYLYTAIHEGFKAGNRV